MNEILGSKVQTKDRTTPYTDAVVQLTGEDGNAFSILSKVRHGIRHSNHPALENEFMREATAGNFDHLLQTCFRYVTVE